MHLVGAVLLILYARCGARPGRGHGRGVRDGHVVGGRVMGGHVMRGQGRLRDGAGGDRGEIAGGGGLGESGREGSADVGCGVAGLDPKTSGLEERAGRGALEGGEGGEGPEALGSTAGSTRRWMK